jgi:hypothetical protein
VADHHRDFGTGDISALWVIELCTDDTTEAARNGGLFHFQRDTYARNDLRCLSADLHSEAGHRRLLFGTMQAGCPP